MHQPYRTKIDLPTQMIPQCAYNYKHDTTVSLKNMIYYY